MKPKKTVLQTISHILAAIVIHLILIYFLGIRIEGGGGTELIILLCKTYILPLAMCFINGLLFSRAKRVRDRITWFVFTVIPSSLLLFLFEVMQSDGGSEDELVFITMPKYSVEMIYLLPIVIIIIQLI
ncbi:hypothetical protein, partial [Paenibacillus phytohabitans]|uniref:hypothetical protein n=1 Tax=Paenibacillus phytohabitans TaxID=2654978 RepID=UPI001C0F3B9E